MTTRSISGSLDFVTECIRIVESRGVIADILPERCIIPLGHVVKNDEISDVISFRFNRLIISLYNPFIVTEWIT